MNGNFQPNEEVMDDDMEDFDERDFEFSEDFDELLDRVNRNEDGQVRNEFMDPFKLKIFYYFNDFDEKETIFISTRSTLYKFTENDDDK